MSVFLARRGFEVTVYERRPDMRRVDIPAGRSINLALANRGINALQKVGLMNEIGEHLIPMRGRMIHDEAGNASLQLYGNKAEEVIYSVSRGELNKTLMNVAESSGVKIEFNQRCERLDLANKALALVDERNDEAREDRFEAVMSMPCTSGLVVATCLSHCRIRTAASPPPSSYPMKAKKASSVCDPKKISRRSSTCVSPMPFHCWPI
jgi:kynurenine 3-monooxygenase